MFKQLNVLYIIMNIVIKYIDRSTYENTVYDRRVDYAYEE